MGMPGRSAPVAYPEGAGRPDLATADPALGARIRPPALPLEPAAGLPKAAGRLSPVAVCPDLPTTDQGRKSHAGSRR